MSRTSMRKKIVYNMGYVWHFYNNHKYMFYWSFKESWNEISNFSNWNIIIYSAMYWPFIYKYRYGYRPEHWLMNIEVRRILSLNYLMTFLMHIQYNIEQWRSDAALSTISLVSSCADDQIKYYWNYFVFVWADVIFF